MGYRVGVDIGGTFTDFCIFDEATGKVSALKVLSTPTTPGKEVLDGMEQCRRIYGVAPEEIRYFTHGQTVGINTVIQRTGARLALFVTENFREVLELERLRIADTFNIRAVRPEPLITRERVIGVRERTGPDGGGRTPLDPASVEKAVRIARSYDVVGVIVGFLNSHFNSAHEDAAAEQVRALAPDLFVFKSSEVWPIIREYERTITAVLNGYVHPKVERYLSSLQDSLRRVGAPARPLVTKSNGGVMSAERGKSSCVHIMLSGTASGVIGASQIARIAGAKNVLSLDIGGTSADLALIIDAEPQYGMGEKVGDFKVFVPSVSVSSIGAGGGSIAWLDSLGVLKVGPRSAGSDPGPACYGRGTEPTVTDAFVVCGFLRAESLGYGAVGVDVDRATSAIAPLANALDLSIVAAAEAIIKVQLSGMYLEASKVLAKHGADPREFTLLPFGGAGPMMACMLASELGIGQVLVPSSPGVLSALGGLFSDVKNDFIRTMYTPLTDEVMPPLRRNFETLIGEGDAWLAQEGGFDGAPRRLLSADMRYHGQSYEIEVVLGSTLADISDAGRIAALFHARHGALYDFADDNAGIEIVNVRVTVSGACPKPELPRIAAAGGPPEPVERRIVTLDGVSVEAPVYERGALRAGHKFDGPCVIVQQDTTTCVNGDFQCAVDAFGNLNLRSKRAFADATG